MKNSGVEWIGEIPENWESIRLKYIYSTTKAKLPKQFYDDKNLTPYLSMDFIRDSINTEPVYAKDGDYCSEEDILILWDGSNAGEIVFNHPAGYAPTTTAILKKLSTQSLPVYDKFYLKALEDDLRRNTNGMGIPHVNGSYLNNSLFLLPPKSTQQHIASYLDIKCSKIEETIQNQQQVIEKLKAYKQSLITEAVTGKVKIENGKVCGEYESYKDSGVEWIGKIPSGWISTRVGHLYKSMLGKMVCPNQLTEEHSLQKYLCAMNVHFDGVDLSEIKEMWFTPNEMNQYQVRNGDLLVVEGGAGAGGASIVYGLSENDKIFIQNSIHLVKPVKTNYLPKYLYYWIYSLVKQNYIDYTCNKATIPHFTKEKLEGMPIAISDKITQQEIIVYLDKKCTAIDTAIEQKQKLIVKLTEYKKSLIYECVTGKKGNLQ